MDGEWNRLENADMPERERQTERERDRERQREGERDSDRDRQTDRQRQTDRDRERQRETERIETKGDRESDIIAFPISKMSLIYHTTLVSRLVI